jgi:hypothetical protein
MKQMEWEAVGEGTGSQVLSYGMGERRVAVKMVALANGGEVEQLRN